MMMIPLQLQNEKFRFVLLGRWNEKKEINGKIMYLGKAPFEKDWQNTGYKYNDTKLLQHIEDKKNIGIIGGKGNLVILDIDDIELVEEFENKINTFTIKTGSGGRHYYFISDYNTNHVLTDERGELRANNYQVVTVPSIHPNGNEYKIIKDEKILEITSDKLRELIAPYLRTYQNIDPETFAIKNEVDTSRSGREWHEVINLIKSGHSKQEVFIRMMAFSKWADSHPRYKEHTYQKAYTIVSKELEEKKHEMKILEETPLEVYKDKDIENLEIQKIDWLVENLIPEYGLTFIGGKSSSYKSTATLHIAYAIANGKLVFNTLKTKQSRVLYLNEENAWNIFKPLIIGIRNGLCETPIETLYFSTFQNLRIDLNNGLKKLSDVIEKNNINVLIFDSLRRFISFEENQADKVNELYVNILKPLMIKYKLSIIVLHHTKKDPSGNNTYHKLDMLRGSSDLVNIADSIIYFKRTLRAEFFSMEQVKNRAAREMDVKKIKIIREGNKILFEDISIGETSDHSLEGTFAAQEILRRLKKDSSITTFKIKEVIEWLEGTCKRTKIFEGLRELLENEIISKDNKSIYRVNKESQEFKNQDNKDFKKDKKLEDFLP